MNKAVIVGSGFVGAAIAYTIVLKELMEDVVLVDINREAAKGEAMDINHGIGSFGTARVRAGDYEDCENSDVIIITAGIGRKPGQSRDELLETNERVMKSVLEEIRPHYTDSFVMVVSNPVDQLTTCAANCGFIPKNKICGTGCMLDTSRWVSELSAYLHVGADRFQAYSVGKHGSNQRMLWERLTVDRIPIEDYCKKEQIVWDENIRQELQKRVTEMGAEIISRKGRTQYGIALTVGFLIQCLKGTESVVESVGTVLYSDACASALVKLGNFRVEPVEQ